MASIINPHSHSDKATAEAEEALSRILLSLYLATISKLPADLVAAACQETKRVCRLTGLDVERVGDLCIELHLSTIREAQKTGDFN